MRNQSSSNIGDFITGLIIFIISFGGLIQSLTMPIFGIGVIRTFGRPGLTPSIICIGLIIMSVVQMIKNYKSIKNIDKNIFQIKNILKNPPIEKIRVLITLLFIIAYAILLPLLRYVKATFLILLVFQLTFAKFANKFTWKYILLIVFISLFVSFGLKYIFTNIFTIPLP